MEQIDPSLSHDVDFGYVCGLVWCPRCAEFPGKTNSTSEQVAFLEEP
jgi:hypothetical protein